MNQNWLSNSTYKSGFTEEFSDNNEKIADNEFMHSDSGDSSVVVNLKTKKRYRHKKINKSQIIKHYLSDLPSISDDSSRFRNYIFLENMPKEDRSNNVFIDVKGNSQISRYGCIYEKHISKYRSSLDGKTLKAKLSQRYYEILKHLKTQDSSATVKRRFCDSHCICHQSFIPIPFDVEIKQTSTIVQLKKDETMINQTTVLNETINKDPHNIDAWIRLINHQSQSINNDNSNSSSINSVIVDRKLSIIEKALRKNQSNIQLHLLRLICGAELWQPDTLQKEWGQLIFNHSTDIDLWRFYISQISRQSIGFSVDKVINLYTKCFGIFFNIMSGRTKTKSINPETVYELCDLFADYCDYLTMSGFTERATASWQAMIEYNFFAPPNLLPKFSGNLLDDPMLISFQKFWQNSRFFFGHPNAKGWAEFIDNLTVNNTENSLESELLDYVSNIESSLLNNNYGEVEMWVKLEQARQEAWWLPDSSTNNDQEDPDRFLTFQSIQPILITLHNPQNITGEIQSSVVSQNAKKKLLLLFLNYLGVSYPYVSIQHNMTISKIRWQQLEQISSADKLLGFAKHRKLLSRNFIQCCIHQLRNSLPGDWNQILSLLELSYAIKSNLSTESWKQALTSIKNCAKTILAVNSENTFLWISYAELLVSLVNHELFKSDKARTTLINEVSKIVEPLVQQVKSISLPLNEKLHVLTLFLDLISKKSIAEFNQSILTNIIETLYPAAYIFSALHSLQSPINKTINSLVNTFSEVVSLISGSYESLVQHWSQAVYFQIISHLISMDFERFREWMVDDCLLTICCIGSSCIWSQEYLYQLSQFLEYSLSFIAWFCRAQGRNDGSFLRSILTPITQKLLQIQINIKKPILEVAISPKLVQSCISNSEISEGQRFKLRNFLWNLVGSFETEIITKFNINCQSSSVLMLSLEINRLNKLISNNICQNIEAFSGRTDRVRSTFTRLINLRCMHWRYRLVMWHSYMLLESQQNSSKRDENTKGVFYRAITELPSQKSLYLSIISLVPSMLEEATSLMKNNHVRLCTPVEEIKLLIRIRQSKSSTTVENF